MEALIEKMNKLLAASFTMYLKAHNFHWNIEGQDFFQYHEFFGTLYNEIWESVDTTAEQIKSLDGYAQGSLTHFKEVSPIRDQVTLPSSISEMVSILYRDNETILGVLNEVHAAASTYNQYGLINYIEGRIDTHKKHGWMLRASLKTLSTAVPAPMPATEEVRRYVLNPRDL